jgi:hypothetical protein
MIILKHSKEGMDFLEDLEVVLVDSEEELIYKI